MSLKVIPGQRPLVVHLIFTREGKQAHCPRQWRDTNRELRSCDGEIAYDDTDSDRRTLKCLRCLWLFAVCEIEQCVLTRWS